MTVTAKIYGQAQVALASKQINLTSDTIKVMLCTSSYTPNQDTHVFKSDVTNEIAAGAGYTAGGVALTNKVVTYDAATHTLKFTADPVTWTGATFTARYAVFYVATGSDSSSPLVCYWNFGTDQSSGTAAFQLFPNASGILTMTVT